jgi:predicted neuraminidase
MLAAGGPLEKAAGQAASDTASRASQSGFELGEFIYETAPFPQCHASTIAEAKDGAGKYGLVAAWFGGKAEGDPSVGIWLARLVDGKWTVPVEVADGLQADGRRLPCWNPVLFQPKDGPLLLFSKVGANVPSWWGELRRSNDGGRTWSKAERLPEGFLGPIKNKPVPLAGGELLCPSSTETPDRDSRWRIVFERTPDLGRTWSKAAPAPVTSGDEINAIQPSILFHPSGKLQAIGRTRSRRIFETWSDDGGKHWTAVSLLEVPNPNSGIDAVTLADGRHLLVYNATEKGRSPLNVAVSQDGKTWQAALVLEDEPRKEFSYPAVIQAGDGKVHITYTWKRQRIKHVVVDPAKLR